MILAGRSRYLICAAALALVIALGAAWLGTHEFVGTFGGTDEPMTCGSIWGLPKTDDLNAASCVGDLRDRLTLVAALLGIAGIVALVPPVMLRRSQKSSTKRRLGALVALGAPILMSVMMIVVGRHLIWSVSGG